MRELRRSIIELGEAFSAEDDAAQDLWTWLPSYQVAQRHHGDYASEHCPSVKDVLAEAAMYIAHLKSPNSPLDDREKQWFNECPCGDAHIPEDVS